MGVRFSRACLSKPDGRPPRTRASHALPAYGRSNECAGVYKKFQGKKLLRKERFVSWAVPNQNPSSAGRGKVLLVHDGVFLDDDGELAKPRQAPYQ